MAKLTATRPILYQNRLYQPGELLPAWDSAIAAAWLEAGSAVCLDDDHSEEKAAVPEAEITENSESAAENNDELSTIEEGPDSAPVSDAETAPNEPSKPTRKNGGKK